MMKTILAFFTILLLGCNSKKVYKEYSRTDTKDPDIILFNVEEKDRSEIAALLLEIEDCNPVIVGIDIIFTDEQSILQDSVLALAIKHIRNDVLAYDLNASGEIYWSNDKFRKFAGDEGYTNLEKTGQVSDHFIPRKETDGIIHESFALKIFKRWRPDFKYDLPYNEPIPIILRRGLDQFHYFVKNDLSNGEVRELLRNKIVLLGYLGPGDDDKYYTPLGNRTVDKAGKPDTYGVVIQANAIRTILEHGK